MYYDDIFMSQNENNNLYYNKMVKNIVIDVEYFKFIVVIYKCFNQCKV